jgi:iron(III) transport system substrate-binding protein
MNSAIYTNLLSEKGMLAVYESPESRYYRDGYKDPRGTWTSIYTNYAVAGYNTKLVAKEDVPKSYADLLKRVWFGQIGLDAKSYEWFRRRDSRPGGGERPQLDAPAGKK